MSDFNNWLQKENIHLNLKAESELETIRTMLDLALTSPVVIKPIQLVQSIFDHEILKGSHRGCSGITFQAISNAVTEPLILLGRFEGGIGYFSKTKIPIDLVVLIVAPRPFEQQFKKMVIRIKDLLCDCEFMESIRNTNNATKIFQHFSQNFLEISIN